MNIHIDYYISICGWVSIPLCVYKYVCVCVSYWFCFSSELPNDTMNAVCVLNHVRLFVTPWTVAHQVPLVHGIFQVRILEWVAIFLLQGIFPTQGLKLCLLCLRHWQAESLSPSNQGSLMESPCAVLTLWPSRLWVVSSPTTLTHQTGVLSDHPGVMRRSQDCIATDNLLRG